VLGRAEVYLQHQALHADPQIRLLVGSPSAVVDLTIAEVEQLATALLAMVEATR
jgi:hypothetical protein